MCKSQFSEKLNILSLAKAFCRNVSGCVIITGVCGWMLTIDPCPVSRLPSLLAEWPLAPESRLLDEREEKIVIHKDQKGNIAVDVFVVSHSPVSSRPTFSPSPADLRVYLLPRSMLAGLRLHLEKAFNLFHFILL